MPTQIDFYFLIIGQPHTPLLCALDIKVVYSEQPFTSHPSDIISFALRRKW